MDGARYIRLWGKAIQVKAQIHTIGALSAHADQDGLVDWYSQLAGHPPVARVHGEPAAMTALAERLPRDYPS